MSPSPSLVSPALMRRSFFRLSSGFRSVAASRRKRAFVLRGSDLLESPRAVKLSEVNVSKLEVMRYFAGYLWPDDLRGRCESIATILGIWASKWLHDQSPAILEDLVERATKMVKVRDGDSGDISDVVGLIVSYAGFELAGNMLSELKSMLYSRAIERAEAGVAREFFEKIQNANMQYLANERAGELLHLISQTSEAMNSLLHNTIIRTIPMIWSVRHMLAQMRRYNDSGLTSISRATLTSYLIFTMLYSNVRANQRLLNSRAESSMKAVLHESMSNLELTRIEGASDTELDKLTQTSTIKGRASLKVQHSLRLLNLGQQAILGGGNLLALVVRANRVFDGTARPGELMAIQHMFHRVTHPLNFAGTIWRTYKSNLATIRDALRIFKIPSVRENPNAPPLKISRGSVLFKNITFTYPGAQAPTIRNVTLRVLGGARVAIVGPSGGGKSTMAKLLLRMYDVDDGGITVCGQRIDEVSLSSMRTQLGVVPQETFLFNATLRDNLLYSSTGDSKPSDAEIHRVLTKLGMTDFIGSLPKGLDTVVGERGSKLSGGQKQRLAIARTLLKKPKILFLDEATSNLDVETEKQILGGIKEVAEGVTQIVVAHRLKSIEHVDQIFFMEGGQIIEAGNHDELLALNGRYAAMSRAQANGLGELVRSETIKEDSAPSSTSTCCGH